MPDIFSKDFREFIDLLNKHDVEYIVAGGFAVILNGYRRPTGDVDIWINNTKENYLKLIRACQQFGLPVRDITLERFLNTEDVDVFTFGRPPVAIDIMARLKGVNINDLIAAKKAAGRYRDLDDIEKLTKTKSDHF